MRAWRRTSPARLFLRQCTLWIPFGEPATSAFGCAKLLKIATTPIYANRLTELPDQEMPSGEELEERLLQRETATQIHTLLHQLPEPYKEVFTLRALGQLSFQQIGALFEKTPNWACVTYHRAKQKIWNRLEETP